jgi:membrane fusion protein, heavy metal efflux system
MTPEEKATGEHRAPYSWRTRLRSVLKVGFISLVARSLLVLLSFSFHAMATPALRTEPTGSANVVQLVGPRLIAVTPGSSLDKKLVIAGASKQKTPAPLLSVTGSVVARLPAGRGPAEDRWQFSSPDLLSVYTDWQKSRADVEFAEKQLAKIRELNAARIAAQTKVVERLRKLVAAGTDPVKDLAAEEANLLQTQLQGQKEVYEAETAVKVATRNRAALARQLQQAGADPDLLGRLPDGSAVAVADVPEAKIGRAREGQACTARFYGLPETVFSGRVSSLAPTLSQERRTLRVLFELSDPQGRLKPGMFADIGLGTDLHETVMVPADGVLHVGRADYVLVGTEPGVWQVTEVTVGEINGTSVEILVGLQGGERVIGNGAILLKPVVVQAVQS